jgi:hypothetical protein
LPPVRMTANILKSWSADKECLDKTIGAAGQKPGRESGAL